MSLSNIDQAQLVFQRASTIIDEIGAIKNTDTNEPHIPTLQEFIALVRTTGLARADRFVANFSIPPNLANIVSMDTAKNLSMWCDSVDLPGKVINTKTLRINTVNEKRASSIDYGGESITFTFIVDRNWDVRSVFDAWIQYIIGDVSHAIQYYENYVMPIQITALNQAPSSIIPSIITNQLGATRQTIDNIANAFGIDILKSQPERPSYSLILHEAWPTEVKSQPFSYSNMTLQKLSVTFTYKWWERVYGGASAGIVTSGPINKVNSPF